MKTTLSSLCLVGLCATGASTVAQPFIPGGVESAGLTYLVPDMPVWYSKIQLPGQPYPGHVTNGPVDTFLQLGTRSWNNGNWEPYLSVLGDSTFLIEAGMFADDGSWLDPAPFGGSPNQRFIVVLQPAAGGAPRIGEVFYDDNGQPYRLHTLLRQRSPGGRVAGDKRYGAMNFFTGGMGSLWYCNLWYGTDYFNSDGRFNTNHLLYATGYGSSCNQDCNAAAATCYPGFTAPCADVETATVQTFSLDAVTLEQTPLSKAQDALFGRCCTNRVPGHVAAQLSNKNYLNRFGGDLAGLDDGNFVCVASDCTGFFGGPSNTFHTAAVIFRPDGSVVKETWLVEQREAWGNVAAYRGGFCIRVQTTFYFYDNAGMLLTNGTLESSGMGFATERGDGTRLASDIRSHYVYLAGPITNGTAVGLGVWDARTGAFVTSAIVTDTDPTVTAVDRVNLAADALDRVCVAYATKPDSTRFSNWQIAARVMKFDGTNISFLTPSFFPFISHDSDPGSIRGYVTSNPSVAMTTKAICIGAKGTLNSINDQDMGPDTASETTVYAVISHPAPVEPPQPLMAIARSQGNATISWPADAGLFRLQSSPTVQPASWSSVSPQPPITRAGDNHEVTVALGAGNSYFRLSR